MADLEESRLKINQIDRQLAELFEQRMDVAKDIALYKKQFGLQVFDASREAEVCKRELDYIKNPLYKTYYLEFIQDLMKVSKKYQSYLLEGSRIAYCGIEGAWANIAAKRIFPKGKLISYSSFPAAYESVIKGECDFAVLPVENSFAGDVSQVFDLMHTGPLFITGMYNLKISQALLGVKGAKLSDIKKVVSHQQAIDQCTEFLQKQHLEVESAVNTAMAAREVAQQNDKSVAAIASVESAELYGLEVIEESINQNAQNTTRFAVFSRVISKEINSNSNCVFQMMFTVKNTPGSLAQAVKSFGDAGFNLKSLRSRPIKDIPWQYYFYVEGEGSLYSEKGEKLIESLRTDCEEVKILGHHSGEKNI
ncbi:MAG: chorismate mutase [Treponema sp.]|nr:chorismate mutase [Treponema sp.]